MECWILSKMLHWMFLPQFPRLKGLPSLFTICWMLNSKAVSRISRPFQIVSAFTMNNMTNSLGGSFSFSRHNLLKLLEILLHLHVALWLLIWHRRQAHLVPSICPDMTKFTRFSLLTRLSFLCVNTSVPVNTWKFALNTKIRWETFFQRTWAACLKHSKLHISSRDPILSHIHVIWHCNFILMSCSFYQSKYEGFTVFLECWEDLLALQQEFQFNALVKSWRLAIPRWQRICLSRPVRQQI